MPVPTSYETEEALALFLANDRELAAALSALGITEDNADEELAEVVTDTLLTMGESDISAISSTDIQKLRTLARYYCWRMVKGQFVIDIDYAADGENFKRDQLTKHANEMFDQYEREAAEYLNIYKVKTSKMVESKNPYTPTDLDDRYTLDRWQ